MIKTSLNILFFIECKPFLMGQLTVIDVPRHDNTMITVYSKTHTSLGS